MSAIVATPPGAPTLVRVSRVLLALLGVLKLSGTVYFTFVATAAQGGEPEGVFDWSVVGWSTVLGVAFLVAAARVGVSRRVAAVVAGLLLVDVVFSLVKLTVYDEPEALGFLAADLVVLALLAVLARRGR